MTKSFALGAALLLVAGCATEDAPPPAAAPAVDGQAVMALVDHQMSFGPRVPGTPGHQAQLRWMVARLDSLAPVVEADTFTHVTQAGDTLTLTNVLARFRPEERRRIVLATHWDTRPTSDNTVDPEGRALPLPGANDGASGTAVLLELARVFRDMAPPMGVDLLFIDGEDYGPETDDMFLGARRYAQGLANADPRPVYGVLLDMVGEADARFEVEAYSIQLAPIVVRKVWDAAARLGYSETFPDVVGKRVGDDHVFLNQAGLPTVDVIDFDYGPGNRYWHTQDDTADKLSAETLLKVTRVMAELVYSGG